MKKILFITSELPPQPGGIGEHAHQLASHLVAYFQVIVLTDQRSVDGVEEAKFDKKQAYRVIRVKRKKILTVTYLQRISETKKYSRDVDLVLVSGKFSLWQAWFIKRRRQNLPIVGIIHGSEVLLPNKRLKKFTDKCLEKIDLVIGVSQYTLNLVKHLKLNNTSVIPNGVVYSNEVDEPIFKEKSNSINLITVGNLTQRKGQHNVIKALPHIKEYFPDVLYHCVGIPSEMKKLQDLARKLGVAEKVKFHGRLSEVDKQNLLQKADIFMMLSEQTPTGDVEGFGIAILEANAMGLPAIGSKNCGIEDAIKDKYSGSLVHPHQPDEVVDAIQDIIDNYKAYSEQAQLHAKQFDWNIVIKQYIKVLSKFVPS